MSFSDSEEDEGIIILEAARDTANVNRRNHHHSPPKKKRKLNHNPSCIAPKRKQSRRKKNTNANAINLRQRGSNIHITPRPIPQNSTNTNNNSTIINIISSSESESDDDESSSSEDEHDTNAVKQQQSHSHTLFLQNQQRRHNLLQYDSSSSSSSSSMNSNALHPLLPRSTQAVYHFGNKQYPNPLNINPGAIVRLELINFLCHSHFAITFHPNINIISGVNGSGKSAIEAGISMALGTSARKTTRGNSVRDVIKFNQHFAKIRLYLHNRGPEALREYGSEICIERKLSSCGKNGTSAFKVLDSKLKTIGTGMRAVRDIAERLNIHVDNPCVVLKQEAAKRFLNSSKDRDKYRFFMQASKLGDFVEVLRESMLNVEAALEQQRQTKESFDAIQSQYNECKRNYDNLQSIESQEELVKVYIESEKWMKYHKKVREVNKHRNKAETIKNKQIRGRNAFERQKVLLAKSVKAATEMKKKIENDAKRIDKYKAPLTKVKKDLKGLEHTKKDLLRKQCAKQKLVERCKKNIKHFEKEIHGLKHEMANNERGKRMSDINDELDECVKELETDRKRLPEFEKHAIANDEMIQKQSILERKSNDLETKMYRITQLEAQLKNLKSRQASTSEVFCPRVAQRKRITIRQIRQLIHRNKHRFKSVPIGPLGEYISVKAHDIITGQNIDEKTQDKYIGVIQAALGELITNFLVSTSADQQLFRQLCHDTFHIVIPCIQYVFDAKRYNIPDDAFRKCNAKDGALLRISELFEVKDSANHDIASWVFNTIITSSQCELKYAYGTLSSARAFLSGLNHYELRCVQCIYTYMEDKGIYRISRRGQSVSGTPVPSSAPLIGADMTRLIQHYTSILNMETIHCSELKNEVDSLEIQVEDMEMRMNEYRDKVKATQGNVHELEERIEQLIASKADIEDDMESNEAHDRIMELQHSIHDEEGMIEQDLREINPYNDVIMEIRHSEKENKLKLKEIEEGIHKEESKVSKSRCEFQQYLDKIKMEKIKMETIPDKLKSLETRIKEQLKFIESQEREINVLLEDAQECGDQITPDQYPVKPPHLLGNGRKMRVKFKLDELIEYRKQMGASIEEWRRMNNNAEEIKQRYFTIKPKYEEHQEAVRKCTNNVAAMKLVLSDRRKEYKKMKACVTDQLNTEFRYVMRQQAHDGNLEVDFEKGSLALKVIMASHDRFDSDEQQHHVVNSKTLSGGEKSFTQIALIMALQKFCGTPMCIYDEFDVFMDSVNRGNSIKILLKTAIKNGGDRQYIFITPHDVSPMMDRRYRDMIRIHKLDAPRPD